MICLNISVGFIFWFNFLCVFVSWSNIKINWLNDNFCVYWSILFFKLLYICLFFIFIFVCMIFLKKLFIVVIVKDCSFLFLVCFNKLIIFISVIGLLVSNNLY